MNKVCFFICVVLWHSSTTFAQCGLDDYEKLINEHCPNCNQSEVNHFVYSNCSQVDSLLNKNILQFKNKVGKSTFTSKEKKELNKIYSSTVKELLFSRKVVVSNMNKLTKDGYNNYYYYLLYWFYTDKINTILLNYENTLFGD
jgi:hypothetical protein